MKRAIAIVLTLSFALLLAAPATPAFAQESDSSAEAADKVVAADAAVTKSDETAEEPQGDEAEASKLTLAEALSGGKATVNLRYRFESVDDDRFGSTGQASTLRTALSYSTKPFRGFRLYLQAENVANVWLSDDHNNVGAGGSGNGVTDRPVVADPPGTEMLQAFVEYANDGSVLQLGRQVINLDDQRHVGAVGWRQHWQSHDAIRFRNDRFDNFTFNYAYLDKNYRITRGRLDTSSHLINAQYKLDSIGTITAYGYLLRYNDMGAWAMSRDTVGAEFKGSHPAGDLTLHYEAEYAHQGDAGDNPLNVDANYLNLMGGVGMNGFTLRVSWESIDGSPGDGQFQFALGTNHAFNGWVDKFLSTPLNGLNDLMIRLDGPLGPVKWQVRYHEFTAKTGDARYGSEVDFVASYAAPWKQTFALKGGFYGADEFSKDASKIWLWTAYSF